MTFLELLNVKPSPPSRVWRWMPEALSAIPTAAMLALVLIAPSALAAENAPAVKQTASSAPASQWVGSAVCQSCHRGRYATWHRTFHRTMTQEANATSVRGRFDGQAVQYWGGVIKPLKRDGRYFFQYFLPGSEELLAEYEITRTVGSHRYQQYLAQTPDTAGTYYRLHLLWHIEDQRWVHMNGVFLGPDNQHFDAQVSVWNHNCIFCHNTGPQPNILNLDELNLRAASGQQVDSATESLYDSTVAELGIACETCHGPGGQHVAVNRNPLRRLWASLRGADDTIVHPQKLPQERAVQICGQCHGQRIAKNRQEIHRWVQQGPSYRAGDDLFDSVELVQPHSQIPGDAASDRFAKRFWGDGTPRLTAYEYQGTGSSTCYPGGDLTCSSCHSMHAGDREGMMTTAQREQGGCRQCHQQMTATAAEHSRHAADSEGSRCVSCHMPRIVYGVMAIHRSHRIEIPDPAADAAAGRPNACNQCHLDQSPRWAAQQRLKLWPSSTAEPAAQSASRPPAAATVYRDDGAPADLAQGVASLYAGDPVQRALAAEAIGRQIAAGQLSPRLWGAHLIAAMTDNYPAVRRFAARSLAQANHALPGGEDEALAAALNRFDFIAAQPQRVAALGHILRRWQAMSTGWPAHQRDDLLLAAGYLPDERVDELQLLGFQRSGEISIGE